MQIVKFIVRKDRTAIHLGNKNGNIFISAQSSLHGITLDN